MLYKFELDYDVGEATKNICCVKSEGTVDQLQGSRNVAHFARILVIKQVQVCLKIMDSKAMSQPYSQTQRVTLGEYRVSTASYSPVVFITFITLAKAFRAAEFCLVLKYFKTFDLNKQWVDYYI